MKPPATGPDRAELRSSSATTEPGLTFRWQKNRGVFSWLPWFLSLSLAAHFGTFFLFRVVYTEPVSIPPPAPQVFILSATNPEHAALLQWIDDEDPALVASLPAKEPPPLYTASYRPSFDTIRTEPIAALHSQTPSVHEFQVRSPHELLRDADPSAIKADSLKKPQPTRLSFSGELQARVLTRAAAFTGSKSTEPLQQARFLIGVSDRGEVRYWFLQESSGNTRIDNEASAHLVSLSFEPAAAPVVWGFATFAWGDEIYSGAAQPASSGEHP